MLMLAQVMLGGYSFLSVIVMLIVVCTAIGILLIVARASGWPIPQYFFQIVGLVVLAVIAIMAIRFLGGV